MGYVNGRTKTLVTLFLIFTFFCFATEKPWLNFWIVLTSLTALLLLVDLMFVSTQNIVFDPFYSNWETHMNTKKY